MDDLKEIKSTIERTKKALALKPVLGQGTGHSKVRITKGLHCVVEEGPWKFEADMPKGAGGSNLAPTPGVYGRGALGACLAIGYMMKAAELEVDIQDLEVEVEADFDDGALFGMVDKNVPPGYLEVRYKVNIISNAPQEKIMQVLDEGDKHSPYLDVFSRGQQCIRTVQINSDKNKP
ncbi:MAG TPA: OsmC family protein [Chitinophagaceae bacterium]|nr:OsmC family protein [Chitinophagaceae bacterium]